jgi:hypothetical protein
LALEYTCPEEKVRKLVFTHSSKSILWELEDFHLDTHVLYSRLGV